MILKIKKFLCYQATDYRGSMHTSYMLGNSERGKFKNTEFSYDTDSQLMCLHDLDSNEKSFVPISNIPQFWTYPESKTKKVKDKDEETQKS